MTHDAASLELPQREQAPAPDERVEQHAAMRHEAPFRARELLVVVLLLALLGIAAYGNYIQHAGFNTDDWSLRKAWLITTDGGQLSHFGSFLKDSPGRPALGFYFAAVQAALGSHQGEYLALAVATAILLSTTIYLVLRELRFSRAPSGIIAALTLIFPGADSLRLWAIMGDASYALSLLFLGAFVTLRSLRAAGRRRIALRALGLVLYAWSLATYEIGMVPLAFSFLLYRSRVRWRSAFREWALDLPVICLVYVLATRHTGAQRLSTSGTLHHALHIARDALKLMGADVLPFGGSGKAALAAAVLVIAIAAVAARRLPPGDPRRGALQRWLSVIAVAAPLAAVSYAVYAPGWTGYTPLGAGLANRVNALGAPLLIAIAYALGALAAVLALWRFPRRYAAIAAAGFGVLLGAFYFVHTREDATTWKRAYVTARDVLGTMTRRIPKPPPGSMVVSFGQAVQESEGVPIWGTTWDLDGALALHYHDLSLDAMPAIPGTTIYCGQALAGPVDRLLPSLFTSADWRPYGKLYLYSVDGRWTIPRNRSQCLRVARTFVPGPWTAPKS